MRKLPLGIFLISLLSGISTVQADTTSPFMGEMAKFNLSAPQEEFSQVTLTNTDDQSISLNQFRGKIVLLNVWATWCGPCVMELPTLDKLQASMGSADFVIVPVSIDRGGAHQAMPFLNRMNISAMTPYFDKSNSIGRLLGASRIPLTIVLGRDGQEIGRLVGTVDWSKPEAADMIRYFIENGGEDVRRKFATPDQVAMSH